MSRPRLSGRVAVITGAQRGIGAGVARAFAAEGAAVAVVYRPVPDCAEPAAKLVAELQAGGGAAAAIPADMSDPGDVEGVVHQVRARLGPIDVVVNNAAASGRASWRELTVEEWDYVQQVNVRGAWLLTRAAHADLAVSEHPSVINVTSVMAETGQPGSLHYTTSKAAIIGLTRALARELGEEGIRVNAVMPGAIRTEHEVDLVPDAAEIHERIVSAQCLKRRGYADDVAGTFVFLASEESAFVTGQVVNVDGGWIHY